jgi:hypothetical protein
LEKLELQSKYFSLDQNVKTTFHKKKILLKIETAVKEKIIQMSKKKEGKNPICHTIAQLW